MRGLVIGLLISLLGLLLAQEAQQAQEAAPVLPAADLKRLLEGPRPPLLLDVREQNERETEGALPGSRHIPLDQLAARLAELPKDRPIVTFCRSARRADVAAALMKSEGFTVLGRAGIQEWKARAYEVHYPPAKPE